MTNTERLSELVLAGWECQIWGHPPYGTHPESHIVTLCSPEMIKKRSISLGKNERIEIRADTLDIALRRAFGEVDRLSQSKEASK